MSFPKRTDFQTDSAFVEALLSEIERLGRDWHYDEAVTQLEHAVQAAMLARDAGESDHVVAAAVLHDVGHFLMYGKARHDPPDGDDLKHEVVGANWLRKSFRDEVSEPVRLHVPAKRYLCATRPGYWEELSEGSKISLKKQGGPMTEAECSRFEELSGYQEAIKLREFDDQAKMVGMAIDSIHSFNGAVLNALRAATSA